MQESPTQIQLFVAGMNASAYEANAMAQAAVERKFEIIGEALGQLAKLDAAMAARIPDLPKIVAFRNQLIHGYATVNVSTVWNVVQTSLPALLSQTKALLDELGEA
ncbi:MAG: HepT-like ribonuclease domain-containing protein [Variovorax sp.]